MPLLLGTPAVRIWATVALPVASAALCGLVAVPPGYKFRRIRSELFLVVRKLLFSHVVYCWCPGANYGRWTPAAAHGPEAFTRAGVGAETRALHAERDFWLALTIFLMWAFVYVVYALQVQKRLRWSPPEGWVRAPTAAPAITAAATSGCGGDRSASPPPPPLRSPTTAPRSPMVPLPTSPATFSPSAARKLPANFPLSELGRAVFASALRQRKAAAAAEAAAAARARMGDTGSSGDC